MTTRLENKKAVKNNINNYETNYELKVPKSKLIIFKRIYRNSFDEKGHLKPFSEQLKNYFDKKTYPGEKLIVLPNNKIIKYANISNVPLEITQHAINSHRDKISKLIIENLPKELENSVMAMDSISRPELNARIIILNKCDNNGNPIIVAIHQKTKKIAIKINKISSIYEKSDMQDFINVTISNGGNIYTNEKTNDWLSFSGLQLPKEVSKNSLVSTKNNSTNIKSSQMTKKHSMIKHTIGNIPINEHLLNKYSNVQEIFDNECFNYNGNVVINYILPESNNLANLNVKEIKEYAFNLFLKYNLKSKYINDNYKINISKTSIDECVEKIFNSKYQRDLLDIHLLVFSKLGKIISKATLVNQASETKIRANINYWNYYFIKLIINKKVYYLEFDVRSMNSGENQYRVQRLKQK